MNKNLVKLFAVVVVVGLVGFAAVAGAQPPQTKAQSPKHHAMMAGKELLGSITALDEATRTLTLKDSTGTLTQFVWTSSTTIRGQLKVGEEVAIRYKVEGGKDVAIAIHVGQAEAAK